MSDAKVKLPRHFGCGQSQVGGQVFLQLVFSRLKQHSWHT